MREHKLDNGGFSDTHCIALATALDYDMSSRLTSEVIDEVKAQLSNWKVVTTTNFGDDKSFIEEENGFYAVAFENQVTGETFRCLTLSAKMSDVQGIEAEIESIRKDIQILLKNEWDRVKIEVETGRELKVF